jgi:two-component system chemotaxis response regulator CheY
MDITMKKMNGIEALKEIKKIDKHIKVIMCSSVKSKEALVKAVQAGATYFIIKPFENDEFIETLRKALQQK